MQQAYIVTGTISDGTTVKLDEAVPLCSGGRVRLVVELLPPEPAKPRQSLAEFMADLRERRQQRGYVPPTQEEMDARIRELRGD
jgi:xanthine/CO dehydrogenase XdhC/CoxF family maturation factor